MNLHERLQETLGINPSQVGVNYVRELLDNLFDRCKECVTPYTLGKTIEEDLIISKEELRKFQEVEELYADFMCEYELFLEMDKVKRAEDEIRQYI